jgi:disulfide oxidoreductase YuzD
VSKGGIKWRDAPDEHDYPAAFSYLSLIFEPSKAEKFVAALKSADMDEFHAKDIFRASGLALLGVSNSHVEKNERKIRDGKSLSPILLVRAFGKVIVADGYHRLCAVYRHDEDALIPCKIV